MRKLLIALLTILPLSAFALDYSDVSSRYTDAPFSRADTVAINVLTHLGIVQGNPDGTFSSFRQVNRAEMAKIISVAAEPSNETPSAQNCFPDVQSNQWFSPYVCQLKSMGIVQGYGDGLFHPERPVTLAEAVKMGVVAWHLILPTYIRAPDHWYDPYLDAARGPGIFLDTLGQADRPLTRGRSVQLVAAFRAYADGDLANYRLVEQGQSPVSSSSSSSSSSVTSSSSSSSSVSSSSSSVSTSSSSSSTADTSGFPARSHFLVAGERSLPIASATFTAALEPMLVRGVEVDLLNKSNAIDTMFLIDSAGNDIGQLHMDKNFDSTEKTWRATFLTGTGAYEIPKDAERVLGIEVRMKQRNQGATSEEMINVRTFRVTTQGEWSQDSSTSGPTSFPFPSQQTAMGRITTVTSVGDTTGILPVGAKQLLGTFQISGYAVTGATLRVEDLQFQVASSPSVTVSNWQLQIPDLSDTLSCTTSDTLVNCSNLPDSMGTLGSGGTRTFRVYGDVALASGATDKSLQLSLSQPGSVTEQGAVRWTDETGHFGWVELDTPMARGIAWR